MIKHIHPQRDSSIVHQAYDKHKVHFEDNGTGQWFGSRQLHAVFRSSSRLKLGAVYTGMHNSTLILIAKILTIYISQSVCYRKRQSGRSDSWLCWTPTARWRPYPETARISQDKECGLHERNARDATSRDVSSLNALFMLVHVALMTIDNYNFLWLIIRYCLGVFLETYAFSITIGFVHL